VNFQRNREESWCGADYGEGKKAKFDDSAEFRSWSPQPLNHKLKLPRIKFPFRYGEAELATARTQAEQANTRADRLATQNDELRAQLVQRSAGGGASQES